MRRSLSLVVGIIFILTGCGGGGGSSRLGGLVPGGNSGSGSSSSSGGGNVSLTLSIPQAASSSSVRRGIRTISSSTQSITVVVNGGTPQIFNVSSNCSGTPLTCKLSVGAPYGLDNFLIETWSGANGAGTALNAATLTMNVKTSGNPSPTVVAGTLLTVTSNADSGGSCGTSSAASGCTLREAVSEASGTSTDTTAIMFQGVSSITLASPISFQKNIVFIGPSSGSLTINGGGNQIFAASGNVVVSNMTLTDGNAASCADTAESFSGGCGGAIELNSGTLTLFSTTFTSNTATQAGGAIYTGSGTTLSIFNGTFTGNKVNASANFDSGGAIYVLGDASIDSSTFTNNSAVGPPGGEGDGGAITQSEFNTAGLTITNSQFLGNSAGGSAATSAFGGAIYEGAGGPVTISNDTFGSSGNGNTSNAGGTGGLAVAGAIYFFGTTLSDGGVANSFVGNSATAPNGGTIGGVAAGGAIASQTGTITLSGANTFNGNSATGSASATGGAIDFENIEGTSFGPPVLTLAPSNTFTSNSAKSTASTDQGAFGGAISFFNINCGSSLTQLASVPRQKGMLVGPSAALKAKVAAAFSRRLAAGSRHAKTLTITTSGLSTLAGTFTSNSAGPSASWGAGGGAINITSDNTEAFTIQNGTFTNNAASAPTTGPTGSGGGAVSVFGGTAIIINSVVGSGNSATTYGGGLFDTSYPALLLPPGCPNLAGTMTIANTTISGNSVNGGSESFFGGGGIAVNSGGIAIFGTTIANNSVTGSAAGGGGGLLALNTGLGFQTSTGLENSTVFNNSSSGVGGGLVNTATVFSQVTLTNDTIYQNSATGNGGNIYNDPTLFGGTVNSGLDVIEAQNTIIAGGKTSGSLSDTADAYNADTFDSLDYNILGVIPQDVPGSAYCLANNTQLTGGHGCPNDLTGSPGLSSGLGNNGGPTQTIADSTPAKGHIPFTNGLCNNAPYTNVDQRGYARGAGEVCDVGAYEFSGTPTNATPMPVPTASVSVSVSSGARRP